MNDIQFQKNYAAFINTNYPVAPVQTNTSQTQDTPKTGSSFSEILQQAQKQQLVFSKHAQQRIDSRQIQITPQFLAQINSAVESAREKGIKDALIVGNQTAFIVNIPTNTVVTTINGQEMNSHVFTNIDGAVVL